MASDDEALIQIRNRWRSIGFAAAWQRIPPERRQRVLGSLEEDARQLGETDPSLAADMLVALDTLETIAESAAAFNAHPASADIQFLLDRLPPKQAG